MAINKITGKSIKDVDISASDLAPGTITSDKIAPGTIAADRLAGSITSAQLAGSIANAKLANSNITINGTSINLGASGDIVAGTDWQAGIVADGSTVTTAVADKGYFIDTTSAAHTINLPGSASLGDEITIIDASGTADTNNITVGRNSHKIQGSAANLTISTERAAFTLVYYNAAQGWLLKDK